MKVSGFGEFGLIDVLAGLVNAESRSGEAWSNLILGIGDDAAAWRCPSGIQLATVDALVEDIHFQLGTISWEELGNH
jgi:thiamine monophosphate kinase